MKEKSKRSPAEGDSLFETDPEPLEECVTSLGGLPLFLRAVRSLDVPGRVRRHLRLKQRERGLDEAAYVEYFLTPNAVGGIVWKISTSCWKRPTWRRWQATGCRARRRRGSFCTGSTTRV